ncbi:hypothetical protein RchiOBHm_Chr5g0044011 [Rosa chinensis]|uniref:Uncharacterized protein n=1 Tax=Rosa chinensis TaxID=74649 RepID=A0A2P6QDI4_ROSCH|nr:hypothetical protein RchiOBHm_Chr5g0044011 [Rosa chinensis]
MKNYDLKRESYYFRNPIINKVCPLHFGRVFHSVKPYIPISLDTDPYIDHTKK